jgi:LuxR family maltose regulon positive regulatory protein
VGLKTRGVSVESVISASKTPLIVTKILTPTCAPRLIQRPRLLDCVAEAETKQVAVIKAGPGFGKTTLAIGWAERLRNNGKAVAWLSLDDDDDEPMRFMLYVSHALRRAVARVGTAAIDLISDFSLVPFNTLVSSWINDLADMDDDVYLFLDDYDCITDHEINDAISYLLRYAPSQFHLILTSKGEPTLPLGRLRAHNRLVEIDSAAMLFDVDETSRLLVQESLDDLEPSTVRLLHAKTEGWPAMLRIVAATLRLPGHDPEAYIHGLSGAMRPIGAFLAEMLDNLPPETVQFMMRTAILDRLSAPLCEAVSGSKVSRQLLEAMDGRQVLISSLDGVGIWYRYHTLLGSYLRERLQAEYGDEILKLHRRAYRWYASQELWTEAIRHAIAAGNNNEALRLVEQCAMELVKKGDLLTLLSWQRLWPVELGQSQVKVALAIAWGFALAMRFDDALAAITRIASQPASADVSEAAALALECDAIRSVVMALKDDTIGAMSVAERCVRASTDPWTANVASNVLRFGRWKAGELESFYATPWLPGSDDEDRRNVFATIYRRCLEGLVEFQLLRISAADRLYLEAARLAERYAGPSTAAAALPASLLARVRYEQGRLDEAEALIVDRRQTIDATGMLECVLSTYLVLVDIARHRRDFDRATALR